MADKTTESRKQRRERRRSLAAEPFEQLDEAAGESGPGQSEAARTLKRALATAVAGAVAAGIGGATKAWLDRRESNGSEQSEQRERGEEPSSDGAEPDVEAEAETTEAAETEAAETEADDAAEAETAEEPEPVAEAETAEEPEPVAEGGEAEEGDEGEQDAAEDEGSDQAQATPRGETGTIVDTARNELEQLLGREVESVSGFERADDGWRVTLEVVEVRRVPESTDVLGSYEVALDDDRNLVSFNQTHRYRRSQVEEA